MFYLEVMLLIFLVLCAVGIFLAKNLVACVLVSMSYNVIVSILWLMMKAPDVALTEAAVNVGISSVLFFLVLMHVGVVKQSRNREDEEIFEPEETMFETDAKFKIPNGSDEPNGAKRKPARIIYCSLCVVFSVALVALLITAYAQMPPYGNPGNPTVNEVHRHYVEKTMEETGVLNIVAGIILDYRAFDTLGEAFVLFTVMISIIVLLCKDSASPDKRAAKIGDTPKMLGVIVLIVTPFIMIYGIYVLLNGHLSPGGGFSGGAILGAALTLYAITFGVKRVKEILSSRIFMLGISISLMFYVIAKGYSFMMGASGLPTGIPKGMPGSILSGGLIPFLNIAVGIVVAFTMYGLYSLFSEGEV